MLVPIRSSIKIRKYLKRNIKAQNKYQAVVVGLSSGGMEAMKKIFPALPKDFGIPVVVVQHLSPLSDSQWISIVDKSCALRIKEADEKEKIERGNIYIAPPNYHLLIETDHTFSLSTEERVSYARPSIDVLFETAADAYRDGLIGIVLTGSNHDGSAGLKAVRRYGGLCIVQDPEEAFSSYMPATALATVEPDHVLTLENIIDLLLKLDKQNRVL